ncbi:NAD(P)H-hydrate dehydratase [Wielerella bovis]|uniref:NAD(P)H-hydrate dehydratase n=1 Tax=Wielerella bovis TaxID=2917790 RepID=UPI0020189D78|nr:NAD(P)H-hydrate dehydratase [Wielerella bovis]MCG7657658.1 NAD(P)H-hydrate dehydratase [Wielerella bovis]MCG7659879.1 NAD(P)H-hydrate dehydratase [Wielerella bovis]ULJ62074.1 NAD(P)H-hydrate dehydratase [Wielerella bovis]ULJ68835.1 NAD(P)H-hydrate dehydratase [Wielerella bovis]
MFNTLPPGITQYAQHAKEFYPSLLKPRAANSHKGTFGMVGVIGGAEGMAGAALLAGSAALYSGCGKVIVGFNQDTLPMPVDSHRPELMLDTAANLVKREDINTWVIGCGLGQTESAARALHALWNSSKPQLVLDADAIHLLVDHSKLFPPMKRSDLVLTPHPGEAAYLLNMGINQVQSNRAWAAREIASRYRCWVVLKGHETVVSSARGFLHVNNSGNAGLATAGSGDVLAGIIGSLLAQGIVAEEAVPAAVWLHGAASEILASAQVGPIGLLADEIATAVRWLRNRLTAV